MGISFFSYDYRRPNVGSAMTLLRCCVSKENALIFCSLHRAAPLSAGGVEHPLDRSKLGCRASDLSS